MNVLFLCTGNSARSILAEAVFLHLAGEGHHAYSAGSHPKSEPHPMALALIRARGLPCDGLVSKNWEVFAKTDAPVMDLVVTVCDNAAGETCPLWPGEPRRLHWSLLDPAAVTEDEVQQRQAFEATYDALSTRIDTLLKDSL